MGDVKVAVGRELTKAHECLVVRHISEHLSLNSEPRGEFTIVVHVTNVPEIGLTPESPGSLREEYDGLVGAGSSPRAAVKTLAKKYSLSSRHVYSIVHHGSGLSVD